MALAIPVRTTVWIDQILFRKSRTKSCANNKTAISERNTTPAKTKRKIPHLCLSSNRFLHLRLRSTASPRWTSISVRKARRAKVARCLSTLFNHNIEKLTEPKSEHIWQSPRSVKYYMKLCRLQEDIPSPYILPKSLFQARLE